MVSKFEFFSENHGGHFGGKFVAFLALSQLLQDKPYAQAAINIPNSEGLTPLGFAIKRHTTRINGLKFISFSDGVENPIDISISDFQSDYSKAIGVVLKSPHLRLNHMFDVPMDPGRASKQARLDDRLLVKAALHPEILVLSYPSHLETILSGDFGGVSEEQKATTLVVCIDEEWFYGSLGQSRGTRSCKWYFNPALASKFGGGILRKFFRRNAAACLLEIRTLRTKLVQKARDLPRKTESMADLKGESNNEKRRQFILDEGRRINEILMVLNSEMPDFFLGGIYRCLARKHQISQDNWNKILEFSGWNQELIDIENVPGIPLPADDSDSDTDEHD
eukprot:Sro1686_g291170.1 n/a (336) ;mRNA; r:19211-20218